jgi:serine/threonine protein kinase
MGVARKPADAFLARELRSSSRPNPSARPMPVTNQALPAGYQLLNYRVDRQISRGGFSIVYRAFDETGAPVAIKEYLPSSLVLRTEGDIVRASSAENMTSFRYGMKCFFEEGRALAKINHPNVVRVLNFFRANETVYMVMRYERGRTLQQQIQMKQDQMSERFVRHVFMHLLNGLREVHTHKILHLDIKPANIYLRTDGSPVLLDFGAARQTLTSNRPKLAPMYTPGFAAPEQYRDPDRLGPWTDIYGTGASMFACLAAFAPQAADARTQEDHLVSAKKIWSGQYSDNLLEVIDWCLRLDPLERPQSVFALQKAIRDIPAKKRKLTFFGNLKRVLFSEIGA